MQYDIIQVQNALEELVQPNYEIRYGTSSTTTSIIEPFANGKFRVNPALFKIRVKIGREEFLKTLSETLGEEYNSKVELTFTPANEERDNRERECKKKSKGIVSKLCSDNIKFNISDTTTEILAGTRKRAISYEDILEGMTLRGAVIRGYS